MGDASPVDLSVRHALTLTINQGCPLGYPEGQHILEVIPGSYSQDLDLWLWTEPQ